MASEANSNHQIGFYCGTTGLITSGFTIDHFTKDGLAVDSVTLASFTIIEIGGGYYYAQYKPTQSGFYYLGFSKVSISCHVADAIDIDEANFVNLTQDTPTDGALKPTLPQAPPSIATPLDQYLLFVYQSSDWEVGRTATTFAVAVTGLDVDGNWANAPLVISPGTYHIVIRNNYGVVKVIQPFLEV